MNEDQFYEMYKPQVNHLDDNASFDGCMYETYGEELDYVYNLSQKENRVWTIVEGDNDTMFICAGLHLVNRIGFLVTEEPWEDPNLEVQLETVKDSFDVIRQALEQYIEDCAGENSDEAKDVEAAWEDVLSTFRVDGSYFQVRIDNNDEYLVMEPDSYEYGYDPQNLVSALETAKEIGGYVVKVTETRIS